MGRTLQRRDRAIRSGHSRLERKSAGGIDRTAIGRRRPQSPADAGFRESGQARLQKTFAATMARAKRYDAQGNSAGCTRELTAAKRMYIL
jgi:hypothetical protein